MTDLYHHSTLQPPKVGVFTYIFPSLPDGYVIIIFIDLVLPMRWVDSLNFFCAF